MRITKENSFEGMDKVAVIVVAGGSGVRMGSSVPKQFLELAGLPVLIHTLRAFTASLPQSDIVLALPREYTSMWANMADRYGFEGIVVCEGGETRFATVRNALSKIDGCDYVMVHDAVRPFVSRELILRVLETVRQNGSAVPVVTPVDSFRVVDGESESCPLDRSQLRAVQTPQAFGVDIIRKAYGADYSASFTDDASVVEKLGVKIALCEGERYNLKITTPIDMVLAESLLNVLKKD